MLVSKISGAGLLLALFPSPVLGKGLRELKGDDLSHVLEKSKADVGDTTPGEYLGEAEAQIDSSDGDQPVRPHSPGPRSLGSTICVDDPEGWYDADGPYYTCAWYARGSNCLWYGDGYANDGKTANEACCACGGGKEQEAPPPGNEDEQLCPPADQMTLEVEKEVLTLVNAARISGTNCGGNYGERPPVPPLTMHTKLSCAARYHSKWMADNDEFSHNSPGGALGNNAGERITNSGYTWTAWGENIAAGYRTAQAVVSGWLSSPGHCANIMNKHFDEIGVGLHTDYSATYSLYWTQAFARSA